MVSKVLAILPLVAVALSGCGGGGTTGAFSVGRLTVEVEWPSRERYVPAYANSLVAVVSNGGQQVSLTINRSGDNGYTGSAQFTQDIRAGMRPVTITAYTQPNGQGVAVAAASLTVNVVPDENNILNVTAILQTTIDHLVIDGQPINVHVGNQSQLSGHARNAANQVILLPAGALQWSVVSGSAHGSITPAGMFTGLSMGTAVVRLEEPGAGKVVEAGVSVTEPPPPGTGQVAISVNWPGRSRYIPPYANSLVAVIDTGSQQFSLTINRSGNSASTGSGQFAQNIPVGTHSLALSAFSDLNGTGELVASASRSVTVQDQQLTTINVTGDLESTVAAIIIEGQPITVEAGSQLQLSGYAVNGQNETILAAAGYLTWSIFSGSQFGSITPTGLFTGTVTGTAVVRLSESGAGVHANANVTVTGAVYHIAFSSDRDAPNKADFFEIYTMTSDGINTARLTNDQSFAGQPGVNHNGTKIAFVSSRDANAGNNWTEDIYTINFNGSGLQRLTNTGFNDAFPAYNYTGTKIVFSSFRDGNWEIYTMNTDGSGQTRLTNNAFEDVHPSFSPDGTKITFTSFRNNNQEIMIMNADGTNQVNLTNHVSEDYKPRFSPDGTRIVFVTTRHGNEQIYTMNTNGTGLTRVTNTSSNEFDPMFTQDGQWIVFVSDRDSSYQLYMIRPNGTGATRITSTNRLDLEPAVRLVP